MEKILINLRNSIRLFKVIVLFQIKYEININLIYYFNLNYVLIYKNQNLQFKALLIKMIKKFPFF